MTKKIDNTDSLSNTTQFTRPLQIGTFVISAESPYTFLEGDPAFFALLGYEKEELTNSPINLFLHQEDVDRALLEVTSQLAVTNQIQLHCRIQKKDGNFFTAQIEGTYYALNATLSVLKCTIVEYVQPKNEPQTNIHTHADLEAFANNMQCSVSKHILNHQLTILWANDFFYTISGYDKKEWIELHGANAIEAIYHKDLAQVVNCTADLAEIDSASLNFRIVGKNGRLIWIHAVGHVSSETHDDFKVLNLILFDITPIMKAENNARIAMDQYKTLSNISEEIAFEYSFGTDTLEFANRYAKCFDFPQFITNPKAIPLDTSYISQETREAFDHFVDVIFSGATDGHGEFQIKEKNGVYAWYSATFAAIYDENNNQIKSIGLLRNIESQKQEQEKLLKKSQLDTATELYNKAATEHFIKKSLTMLTAAKTDALMLIDIDDFKNINDGYGHLTGDEAILQIANAMKSVVTTNDLPGRIGGDEFAIYFRDILDTAILTEKAEIIANKLRDAYPGGNTSPKVTLSIGIATATTGVTYEQLLDRADTALYRAKAKGKNCNVLYMQEMERDQYVNDRQNKAANIYQELSNALIECFYRAGNTDNVITQAFAFLGNNLPIDKIGIFEYAQDKEHLNCTYQWNRNPLDSTKGKEQGLLATPFIELYNLANNSIFYTPNTQNLKLVNIEAIADPSYICKLATTKIEHDGNVIAFMSVASKDVENGWEDDILKLITLTARLLAPHLRLKHTQDELEQFTRAFTKEK